jgi:chromosome segregation ATPase
MKNPFLEKLKVVFGKGAEVQTIDDSLSDTIKLLKASLNQMREQRTTLQTEIQRQKDLSVQARTRIKDLQNEIVAHNISAENAETKVRQMHEQLVKLDEDVRRVHEHLKKI